LTQRAGLAQIDAFMDIGVFQLLPRGRAATDREVVEQALWEVDFAEQNGFESIWVTEHHFSGYGSIGVPSVYAAGIAQRTRRIRIGYGVAVAPIIRCGSPRRSAADHLMREG
jgi:alkanesulfonate monooxygenase SsuD/methylene tetrahydromethanopterin reductase-like flavin-dependent oxidoreductase (luciferase family)